MIKVDTERYGHKTTAAYSRAAADAVLAQSGLKSPAFETWQNLMEGVRHSAYLQGLEAGLNGDVDLWQLQQAEGPHSHARVGDPILDGRRPDEAAQLAEKAMQSPGLRDLKPLEVSRAETARFLRLVETPPPTLASGAQKVGTARVVPKSPRRRGVSAGYTAGVIYPPGKRDPKGNGFGTERA